MHIVRGRVVLMLLINVCMYFTLDGGLVPSTEREISPVVKAYVDRIGKSPASVKSTTDYLLIVR